MSNACPVVPHFHETKVECTGQQPSKAESVRPKEDSPRCMSFDVRWEGSRRVLVPTADGVELFGVKACAVACNSDGTRTMTIELELE